MEKIKWLFFHGATSFIHDKILENQQEAAKLS